MGGHPQQQQPTGGAYPAYPPQNPTAGGYPPPNPGPTAGAGGYPPQQGQMYPTLPGTGGQPGYGTSSGANPGI